VCHTAPSLEALQTLLVSALAEPSHLVERRHGAGTEAGLAGHVQRVLDDVDLVAAQIAATLRAGMMIRSTSSA